MSIDKANFEGFIAAFQSAADEFKKICDKKKVRLVSNLDADGISAASIMVHALERQGIEYSLLILHQLLEDDVKALAEEDYPIFVFCDLGSGQLKHINKYLSERRVFVLDHHEIQGQPGKDVVQLNPHDHGYEGSTEISAAGVCFFFARELDKRNEELAHLAIIGAIGDVQEKDGFKALNKKILEIAVNNKIIRVEKGLKLFGLETRPLNKLLMYSGDIIIPEVTNDDKGSRRFLKELGIKSFCRGEPRNFYDLSDDERKLFVDGIIKKRKEAGMECADEIYTNIYFIEGEKRGPFRDAKEFSTLLNSCGRMDNATLGIGACLGDEKQRKEAVRSLKDYRRQIVNSLCWFKKNSTEGSSRIIKGHNYLIINARDDVLSTIIGTLASMISKNKSFEKDIFVLSMARNDDDTTKISLRISGNPACVDLKEVIAGIVSIVGGEAGGHQHAAGAIIETGKEDEFIACAKETFESMCRENQ